MVNKSWKNQISVGIQYLKWLQSMKVHGLLTEIDILIKVPVSCCCKKNPKLLYLIRRYSRISFSDA
jgi:hypothetical protein